MKKLMNPQVQRQLILVIVGALLLYAGIHFFYIYKLPPFLKAYSNYRNSVPYAWTDLWFQTSLLAGLLVGILACGYLMFGSSRGLMICVVISLIISLLILVGNALRALYYLHIGWLVFLARPYGWMVFLNTVGLALFFIIFFISFEQPAWQSNLLLARSFNITVMIMATADAMFTWFARYPSLLSVLIDGSIFCLLGSMVLLKRIPFFNLFISNPMPYNNQKLNHDEKLHLLTWTTISGVIVLGAGVWIIITGLLMAKH
jgi:hypothetical protein